MAAKLKPCPCPFCGSGRPQEVFRDYTGRIRATCQKCGAAGPTGYTNSQARRLWLIRAPGVDSATPVDQD